MRLVSEQHQIKAGSQFTEEVPDLGYRDRLNTRVYYPAAKGGLFMLPIADDADSIYHRLVVSIMIQFGSQSAWTLNITDGVYTYAWKSGTTEVSLVSTDKAYLLPGEYLVLDTTAATGAMSAVIAYSRRF